MTIIKPTQNITVHKSRGHVVGLRGDKS